VADDVDVHISADVKAIFELLVLHSWYCLTVYKTQEFCSFLILFSLPSSYFLSRNYDYFVQPICQFVGEVHRQVTLYDDSEHCIRSVAIRTQCRFPTLMM